MSSATRFLKYIRTRLGTLVWNSNEVVGRSKAETEVAPVNPHHRAAEAGRVPEGLEEMLVTAIAHLQAAHSNPEVARAQIAMALLVLEPLVQNDYSSSNVVIQPPPITFSP